MLKLNPIGVLSFMWKIVIFLGLFGESYVLRAEGRLSHAQIISGILQRLLYMIVTQTYKRLFAMGTFHIYDFM